MLGGTTQLLKTEQCVWSLVIQMWFSHGLNHPVCGFKRATIQNCPVRDEVSYMSTSGVANSGEDTETKMMQHRLAERKSAKVLFPQEDEIP